ncbi:hypothetical protein LCGC14_2367760 [marine sediment metagenome]|uniref:Uncharacterized protein n=1 Tax=marine sediment metagenome TaxID=412755 RepID=A0A0F9EH44_9ZZZZ
MGTGTYSRRVAEGVCVDCACSLSERAKTRRCPSCQEALNKQNRDLHAKDKLAAFAAYGGAFCSCCGEKEAAFLTLDHVNGDGGMDRVHIGGKRQARYGGKWYRRLRWQGYPTDPLLQVLCSNCNLGKHLKGVCPHKEVVR